jgi:hypothetical protein
VHMAGAIGYLNSWAEEWWNARRGVDHRRQALHALLRATGQATTPEKELMDLFADGRLSPAMHQFLVAPPHGAPRSPAVPSDPALPAPLLPILLVFVTPARPAMQRFLVASPHVVPRSPDVPSASALPASLLLLLSCGVARALPAMHLSLVHPLHTLRPVSCRSVRFCPPSLPCCSLCQVVWSVLVPACTTSWCIPCTRFATASCH